MFYVGLITNGLEKIFRKKIKILGEMQTYRPFVNLVYLSCTISIITLHTTINPYVSLLKINICMFSLHDSMNMYKVSWCINIQHSKNAFDKKKNSNPIRNARVYTPCICSTFVLYDYSISVPCTLQQILIFFLLLKTNMSMF